MQCLQKDAEDSDLENAVAVLVNEIKKLIHKKIETKFNLI